MNQIQREFATSFDKCRYQNYKQMSSKILSVSEKTRRQFLQQKIPYRDPSRVELSLDKSQPRSQALSSLPPVVVGRKTLVAASHVTTCDTNFSTGVDSTNNFCRSQLKRKEVDRWSSTHGQIHL